MDEVELYKQRLDDALQANPDKPRPTFALMRHAQVYNTAADREAAIAGVQSVLGKFENLFRNLGDVVNGFPKEIPLSELENRDEYSAEMLETNLMFGTPDEVIAKLKLYEALGVDEFIYYGSMGLDHEQQKEPYAKPRRGDLIVGRIDRHLPMALTPALMLDLRGDFVG